MKGYITVPYAQPCKKDLILEILFTWLTSVIKLSSKSLINYIFLGCVDSFCRISDENGHGS